MKTLKKAILVTGSEGFIGRNLVQHLWHSKEYEPVEFHRGSTLSDLPGMIKRCDAVIHLAGVNRSPRESDFEESNVGLTSRLLESLTAVKPLPVFLASSIHAETNTPYGRTKRTAEELVRQYAGHNGVPTRIARLPNVFGKWSRPNHNSVVATFAYNIAHEVHSDTINGNQIVDLVYVDDLISSLMEDLERNFVEPTFNLRPIYRISVGNLYATLRDIHELRSKGKILNVGEGFRRALYSTYVSFLEPDLFSYPLSAHEDERGVFVEVIKTPSSGQFSFFTARQGFSRGSHFHHSKVEKFVVVKGDASFNYRNVISGKNHQVRVSSAEPVVVESIPGWVHEIENIGKDELIVMVWANEVFDPNAPDTFGDVIRN